MPGKRNFAILSLLPLAALLHPSNAALADPDIDANEIRVGSTTPYTGALAAFAAIGRTEAAYFDKFDGNTWQPIGDVFDSAFPGGTNLMASQ